MTRKPTVTVMVQNGKYTVQVFGRYGGGYTSPGHTLAEAVDMVLRDTPKYGGKERIEFSLPDEVRAEMNRRLETDMKSESVDKSKQ